MNHRAVLWEMACMMQTYGSLMHFSVHPCCFPFSFKLVFFSLYSKLAKQNLFHVPLFLHSFMHSMLKLIVCTSSLLSFHVILGLPFTILIHLHNLHDLDISFYKSIPSQKPILHLFNHSLTSSVLPLKTSFLPLSILFSLHLSLEKSIFAACILPVILLFYTHVSLPYIRIY